MLSLSVPVNFWVKVALLPAGRMSLKEMVVVWVSSLCVNSGEEEMTLIPDVIFVECILRSRIFNEMNDVSSITSRLQSVNDFEPSYIETDLDLLNIDLAIELKGLKVWLEGELVVKWLNIFR